MQIICVLFLVLIPERESTVITDTTPAPARTRASRPHLRAGPVGVDMEWYMSEAPDNFDNGNATWEFKESKVHRKEDFALFYDGNDFFCGVPTDILKTGITPKTITRTFNYAEEYHCPDSFLLETLHDAGSFHGVKLQELEQGACMDSSLCLLEVTRRIDSEVKDKVERRLEQLSRAMDQQPINKLNHWEFYDAYKNYLGLDENPVSFRLGSETESCIENEFCGPADHFGDKVLAIDYIQDGNDFSNISNDFRWGEVKNSISKFLASISELPESGYRGKLLGDKHSDLMSGDMGDLMYIRKMPPNMEVTQANGVKVNLQMTLESIYLLRAQTVYLKETFDFQWKLSIVVLTASSVGVLAVLVSFVAMMSRVYKTITKEWEIKRCARYTEEFVPLWVYNMNKLIQDNKKKSKQNAAMPEGDSERDTLLQMPALQHLASNVTKTMLKNQLNSRR